MTRKMDTKIRLLRLLIFPLFILLILCTPTSTLQMPRIHESILDEVSWNLKLILLKDYKENVKTSRRVGLQFLIMPERRQNLVEPQPHGTGDDHDMRLKLFRLMYETIRDSDLKVKRAELIRSHYTNLTSFDIGYIMGDITDKFNIMGDVSSTMKKLYDEWKPIEHINAYEQIANQAIEVNHLVDMIRTLSKKNDTL